jgi:hypothetical protein
MQNDITRHHRRFNAEGRELTVWLTAPPPAIAAVRDPARHFSNNVDELFQYSLRPLEPGDSGNIDPQRNQQDRPLGVSFRRRDQISRESCGACSRK